jgi:alpha-methylacyl-CoA racemase
LSGPLRGIRVLELAGIGPVPFCGMVLADLGADVVRIDRPTPAVVPTVITPQIDVTNRGKRSIAVDLKSEMGVSVLLDLASTADVLIEGFRPGVTERLGIGPAECLARNRRLVYGRMTGWGQSGPLAKTAGHDIDYIAVNGVLHSIGGRESPVPPLNLVGDFGGGAMLLAIGVLAAVLHAQRTGYGQAVDAAMVDGSALLMASHHGFVADGWWNGSERQSNVLDGAAPFYTTYETADGRHVAVGALEPQFFRELTVGLGVDAEDLGNPSDRADWAGMREVFAAVFATRTRDEWMVVFDGTDACVAPVMNMIEAIDHPHISARATFVSAFGVTQPAPAPRFADTVTHIDSEPCQSGEHTDVLLTELGYNVERIGMLREAGAVF